MFRGHFQTNKIVALYIWATRPAKPQLHLEMTQLVPIKTQTLIEVQLKFHMNFFF